VNVCGAALPVNMTADWATELALEDGVKVIDVAREVGRFNGKR